jgi:hypothetical protein
MLITLALFVLIGVVAAVCIVAAIHASGEGAEGHFAGSTRNRAALSE